MLQRIRKTSLDPNYWAALRNPAPTIGDEIIAKIIGQKCPGALSPQEIGILESLAANGMAAFAKTASEAGTKATRDVYEDARTQFAERFGGPSDCTAEMTNRAKDIMVRVQKQSAMKEK